ncbi:MAG: 4'-phosphopantetheinyl transferase superfamily protein [Propionibacteriaceae bacterium]|jgi:4'-phosphopantetheinyl transferase EntD|nr:4'-phosphopantetheinyl transferase superfamily protein [Propionibacteriaceae bacterium]
MDGSRPLRGVLPPAVAVVETRADHAAELWPAEAAVVAGAAPARQAEFATGRWCARAALDALGEPAVPLVPGPRRAPSWPDGVVGSLTHCAGYRAAAVARANQFRAIGVDAEPNLPLSEAVLTRVSSEAERAGVGALGRSQPGIAWDRLLFSAKESVYKAWSVLTQAPLGFADAVVGFGADGTFAFALRATLRPALAEPLVWHAAWAVGDGIAVTAVWAYA